MENEPDPLAQSDLDTIDLRWTLKDIAAKRHLMMNKQHLAKLIDLGLVEMRDDTPYLTVAGQNNGVAGLTTPRDLAFVADKDDGVIRVRCEACQATGRFADQACLSCGGEGFRWRAAKPRLNRPSRRPPKSRDRP